MSPSVTVAKPDILIVVPSLVLGQPGFFLFGGKLAFFSAPARLNSLPLAFPVEDALRRKL